MARNLTITIGMGLALGVSIIMFLIAHSGLNNMIAESSIYSTWPLESMMLTMIIAFVIAFAVGIIGLIVSLKK